MGAHPLPAAGLCTSMQPGCSTVPHLAFEVTQGPELGTMLQQAASLLQILELVHKWGRLFDSRLAARALHGVADLRPQDLQPVLAHPGWQKLLQLAHDHAGRFSPCELANSILGSLGTLNQAPLQLLHVVLQAVEAKLHFFDSFELATAVAQLARLTKKCPSLRPDDALPSGFLEAVEQHASGTLSAVEGVEILGYMYSFVTLGHKPSQHFMTLTLRRLAEVVQQCSPVTSNILTWAFAKLEYRLPPHLRQLCQHGRASTSKPSRAWQQHLVPGPCFGCWSCRPSKRQPPGSISSLVRPSAASSACLDLKAGIA